MIRPWTRRELLRALLSAVFCSAFCALASLASEFKLAAACVGLAAGPLVLLGCWLDDGPRREGWAQLRAALLSNLVAIALLGGLFAQSVYLAVLLDGGTLSEAGKQANLLVAEWHKLVPALAIAGTGFGLGEGLNRERLDFLPAFGATWLASVLLFAVFAANGPGARGDPPWPLVPVLPLCSAIPSLILALLVRVALRLADRIAGAAPRDDDAPRLRLARARQARSGGAPPPEPLSEAPSAPPDTCGE